MCRELPVEARDAPDPARRRPAAGACGRRSPATTLLESAAPCETSASEFRIFSIRDAFSSVRSSSATGLEPGTAWRRGRSGRRLFAIRLVPQQEALAEPSLEGRLVELVSPGDVEDGHSAGDEDDAFLGALATALVAQDDVPEVGGVGERRELAVVDQPVERSADDAVVVLELVGRGECVQNVGLVQVDVVVDDPAVEPEGVLRLHRAGEEHGRARS